MAIGPALPGHAEQVIDATGLAVAPGFIDLHSHTDRTILENPGAASKILQGVTTEVVGNCGIGSFPVSAGHHTELEDSFNSLEGDSDIAVTWADCAGFARVVEKAAPAVNLIPLVAHGALRIAVMGSVDRPPSSGEMAQMEELLAENLRQGAWGLSTGLIYPPGSYAKIEELVALGRVLASYGAIYTSHLRSEEAALHAAVEEAVQVARASGVRVEISHLKAVGRPFWGGGAEAAIRLQALRAEGVDIWADQYPYLATSTGLSVLLSGWVHEGGREKMLQRLADPELAGQLRREIAEAVAVRGDAGTIQIAATNTPRNRALCGRTLADVAQLWQTTPADAVIRLLSEEGGVVSAVYFSLDETELETILRRPDVSVGSDGYAMNAELYKNSVTHPRSYGTFPRVLGHFVREKKLLSLETAVRKMTSLPSDILGMTDRGRIKCGFAADLTLFDPATVRDNATFIQPHLYPDGIPHVIVNGRMAVKEGRLTGDRPGRVLKKTPTN
ncbi:MAG: D-aminoacylase [Negativicutes bacterium]|nr:D-aminoacylase [Negativicutes bacterium]MDR3590737.1 D-aminoacylase [Negativicutes bacterium]